MKRYHGAPKAWTVGQAILVYCWLTVLSDLAETDTYYSVYLLCGVLGCLCLYDNRTAAPREGRERRLLGVFAGVFSGAVALANYSLFEPLTVLQNCFDLVCVLLGGWVIGYQVLLCMLRHLPLQGVDRERKHPGRVFALAFCSIALIDLGYLFFALYPGVLTTDSYSTIGQILGTQPYNNTMPFWHTVSVELFVELGLRLFGDINAAVALFHCAQILFMATAFGFAIATMYQIGAPVWFLLSVWVLYGCMPYNIVYSVTLWKDIPFAGAALLFVTGLYRLVKGVGRRAWVNYGAFLVGAVGFSLLRTNGWYAFAVMALFMIPLLWKQNRRLLVIILAVLVLCWVLINPVLDILGVASTNMVEAFAVPMQQIARVLHNGRELTAEETALLQEAFLIDRVIEEYDPQTVDPVKFETFRYDNLEYIKENFGKFLGLYLKLGLKYPMDYVKAWVEETKGYWNGGYKFWTYTLKLGENEFGIYQTPGDNLLAKLYAAWFRYVEKPEILQWTISIGLHVWALVSCCLVNCMKKRREYLLCIPILVLIGGLWLGTPVFSEWRYAYPLILTMPMILATTVYDPVK